MCSFFENGREDRKQTTSRYIDTTTDNNIIFFLYIKITHLNFFTKITICTEHKIVKIQTTEYEIKQLNMKNQHFPNAPGRETL